MSRAAIYQLFVRHFSNSTEDQTLDGSLQENGCGTFNGINSKALNELANMGFSHIWFTGVLEHASQTDYPDRPADPSSITKGKAGSPYAIRDYYDVCPDYAEVFENRLDEFCALIARTHDAGLKSLIDFVPNHVARSYDSDIRPKQNFGTKDDASSFYKRDNSFYYLEGEGELTLPDGRGPYIPEKNKGRVTGNNQNTWTPTIHDWYETVKLNYGYDFLNKETLWTLPKADAPVESVPETWRKMLNILLYWAKFGINGVRCDMAHMVPVQFWDWIITQVRMHYPDFFFIAEAYANDPMSCLPSNSLHHLSNAGFDAYYDQALYHTLKSVTEGHQGTSALDAALFQEDCQHKGIRYIENHDEVRSANPKHFGSVFQNLGSCATSWLLGKGPVMLYNGQEVGEPAIGATGYSDDNARSSIFDYSCLPELQKWTNHGAFDGVHLESWQRTLREEYQNLLHIISKEPFVSGETYGLNHMNQNFNSSGLYSFLRFTRGLYGQMSLVVTVMKEKSPKRVSVTIPKEALEYADWNSCEIVGFSAHTKCSISSSKNKNGDLNIEVPIGNHYGILRLIPIS